MYAIFYGLFMYSWNFLINYRYPTKPQLTEICLAILKTYPFLKDRCIWSGYVSNEINYTS